MVRSGHACRDRPPCAPLNSAGRSWNRFATSGSIIPTRVQRKMEVLWLKYQGLTHAEIAALADVAPRSVQRYLDEFLEGGLEQIRRIPWQGKESELDEYQGSLEDYFLSNPPRSAREAQEAIERLTGVRRGLTQVRSFLKKTGAGLAEGGHGAGQGRPRRAGRVPRRGTAAPARAREAR